MNLTFIDWAIVVVTLLFILSGVIFSKRFLRSVSDFLAAGRTAGRYVVSLSQGMSMVGAISIVGLLEMYYISGFTLRWWEYINALVIVAITASGWVVYRFRQTRALTMAQFFEIRYSRNFRIFAGILAFAGGIINFGIFPAVGARFFIYYCGIPTSFPLLGLTVSTYPVAMLILLIVALYFVFAGGQIAVIITDFMQGILVNAVFVVIVAYLMFNFDWDVISSALVKAPEDASLINPFKAGNIEDYNFWYFFIGMIGLIYGKLSWQGTQAYNASAKSAHEAKMGEVLGNWRNIPQWHLFIVIVPIIVYTVFHTDAYSHIVTAIKPVLDSQPSEAVSSQLRVPMVLTQILPVGLIGAFAAIMLAAFISTHDTYLHSWGSIFIQDVIMPFRKKPFTPEQHLRVLKLSIIGVAIFIFFFSLLFRQSEYIFLFLAITGAIFTGGSGAVIIGGLYWKRGTTAAAWSALITGSVIAVGGIICQQIWEDFPINGQWFWGIAMAASTVIYIVVSLLGKKTEFNMDKLLHRGKYEVEDEVKVINKNVGRGWQYFGMGKEFTTSDKIIYITTYSYNFFWTIVFLVGTFYNLADDVGNSWWLQYWEIYTWVNLAVSTIVVIWFSIGGVKNLKEMFQTLSSMERDHSDDGFVFDNNEKEDR